MKAWVVVVSTVVGALSGFVVYFLWVLPPSNPNIYYVMGACAAMGCLFAVSFLLPWPWQHDSDDNASWPWPGDDG